MTISKNHLKQLKKIYNKEELISFADNEPDNFPNGQITIIKTPNFNHQDEMRYNTVMDSLNFFSNNTFEMINMENPTMNPEKFNMVFSQLDLLRYNTLSLMDAVSTTYSPGFSIRGLSENIKSWKKFADRYEINHESESNDLNSKLEEFNAYVEKNNVTKKISEELRKIYIATNHLKLAVSLATDQIDESLRNHIDDFYNDIMAKDSFYQTYKETSFTDFTDKIWLIDKNESVSIVNDIENIFMEIYEKTKKEKNWTFTFAEDYQKLIAEEMSITQTLNKKQFFDEFLFSHIDLTNNNSNVSEFIIFKDNSVILKLNDETIKKPVKNNDIKQDIETIFNAEISHILRKKPVLSKIALKSLSSNYAKVEGLIVLLETYTNNENILKSKGYDLNKKLQSNKSYEYIDDEMNVEIIDHKMRQYADSIASNKYKHLYNEESYIIISELYFSDVDKNLLQVLIGKKLASYKTPEDFNAGLKRMIDSLNGFDHETILLKAKVNEATIVSNLDDILILEINNYKQSQSLGSPSWCISRQEYYFDSYVDETNRQYFIFDFNKRSDDNNSMIGITLDLKGNIVAAHLKNDEAISENNQFISDIINTIKEKQRKSYTFKTLTNMAL